LKLTEFSLRNPLAVATIALALACFGVYAFLTLGVGIVPNVNTAQIAITTTDAGADPATVETQVTKPIEDAVAALPNVDTVTSTSSEGVSSVTVQFTTAANANLVSVDVERAINAARNRLPSDAEPPAITQFDTSAYPVIGVALSGPQSPEQLQQVATGTVQRAMEAVPGVQSVTVGGGQEREGENERKQESHEPGVQSHMLSSCEKSGECHADDYEGWPRGLQAARRAL